MRAANVLLWGLFIVYSVSVILVADLIAILGPLSMLALLFATKKIFELNSISSFKMVLATSWGELISSITGACILPFLIYQNSDEDVGVALLSLLIIFPSSFLIFFLWLKFISYSMKLLKKKIFGL